MCDLTNPIFNDDDKAREHLEAIRWPNGPVCAQCGALERIVKVQGKSARPGLYYCNHCAGQFTVTVGTVFERSKVPLSKWVLAFHLMCSSKKGISSHQLHRMLDVTYKTAWFMSHRIREAMRTEPSGPLGGAGKIVEADETYYGNKKGAEWKWGGTGHKHSIVALVEHKGGVRSFHVPDVTAKNLKPVLLSQIDSKTHLMTDEATRYWKLGKQFAKHSSVNHSEKEYARGNTSTNTIEGFFSLLKRGLISCYFHISGDHLQRYCDEFDFRYSNREKRVKIAGKWQKTGLNDAERTVAALKGIEGKRLTYRRVTGFKPQA